MKRSRKLARRRHHTAEAYENPGLSTGAKWAIGLGALAVVGGGIYYYLNAAAVTVNLTPGQVAAVHLNLMFKQPLVISGGAVSVIGGTDAGTVLSISGTSAVPVAAGSSTVTVTWQDAAGNQQITTIPVTVS